MSLASYSDLKTSVANWLHRDNDAQLAAVIPDMIAIAEARLSSDLNARDMDARMNIQTTGEYITGPSDFVELRRALLLTDPKQKLNYRTPDQLSEMYSYPQPGKPAVFTVIGEQIQLAPIPDSEYTLELTYKQRLPALSDAAPTNWLLTKYPMAYLYATLCESQLYIVNDPRLPVWEQQYQKAVGVINSIDWYSGSTMTMQTDLGRKL